MTIFSPDDWQFLPEYFVSNKCAPYTDDTRMAKLVLRILLKNKDKLSEKLNVLIAQAFLDDQQNNLYGWDAHYRAPGISCKEAMGVLHKQQQMQKDRWWDVGFVDGGGCGSVMRAHPFGLIFYENPDYAAQLAAQHSVITHGSPLALAACAAVAGGTALLMSDKPFNEVTERMIGYAQESCAFTAAQMRFALFLAVGGDAEQEVAAFANALEIYIAQLEAEGLPYVKYEFKKLCLLREKKHLLSGNQRTLLEYHEFVYTLFFGFAAHDAVAAVLYSLAVMEKAQGDIDDLLFLTVHTPGDSDSIASIATAMFAARYEDESLPLLQKHCVEGKDVFEEWLLHENMGFPIDGSIVWLYNKHIVFSF